MAQELQNMGKDIRFLTNFIGVQNSCFVFGGQEITNADKSDVSFRFVFAKLSDQYANQQHQIIDCVRNSIDVFLAVAKNYREVPTFGGNKIGDSTKT